MRIALAFSVILAITACASKKKAPQAPASPAEATERNQDEMQEKSKAEDPEAEPTMRTSDPEEGGE